ncbi:hypothetical protein GTW25_11490 [Aliihoeflea aestuarii]|uniref:hypothetical protein n=1 Tax=Aliihoeflea aestuarii TaxID=453840 RepID=UPI002091F13C|nr:hypothetical protein [Aliihoeflea aestuarii]MCO6391654.1 hypothetical protein [Aliihoeflea aestuarii]
MKAQLTIYVAPPLLEQGGTVIVVADEIPLNDWEAIADGTNPALADTQNEKRKELNPGDQLFGVVASTKVSIIEFVYPEGGTYGFNLVPVQDADRTSPQLRTDRILQGEGGGGPGREWNEVSTVHVFGSVVSERDSRVVRASSSMIMRAEPEKSVYQGAVLYSPTDELVENVLIRPKE